MIDVQSTRKYRRIPVGPEHTVAFRLNGIELKQVPLLNLSAGGCFALLPRAMAVTIRSGYLFMDFRLEHKELPETPFCSRVVHVVQGLSQAPERDLGLGISFLSTSPGFYQRIDAYVSAHTSGAPE